MDSLNDWFEKYEATKLLKENLETNLEILGSKLSKEEKESIMRMNMIMIRQCLQDCGVE
jgi:hypothetical protein